MFFKKLKLHTPEYSYALKNTLAKFKLNSKSYTAISREVFGKRFFPRGVVGGLGFTVLQRMLKKWHEKPRTYVC